MNIPLEQWKPVPFAPVYMVSDSGRVMSLPRSARIGKFGSRSIPGGELTLVLCKTTGYLKCSIHKKQYFVHRIVAEAFHGEPISGFQVNHKNGIRHDNRVDNLEWVTCSQNIQHAFSVLGRAATTKGKFGALHPTSKPVKAINVSTGEAMQFACALDAVRKFGFDSGGISKCCAGIQKRHKGFTWEWVR